MLHMNKKILIAAFMALPAAGMAQTPADAVVNTVNQGVDLYNSVQATQNQAVNLGASTITSTATGLQSLVESAGSTLNQAEQFFGPLFSPLIQLFNQLLGR